MLITKCALRRPLVGSFSGHWHCEIPRSSVASTSSLSTTVFTKFPPTGQFHCPTKQWNSLSTSCWCVIFQILPLKIKFLFPAINCRALWRRVMKTLDSSASKSSIRRFVITEKAPTRAFSWLKAPTSAFTIKTLLRHYAKQALTPRSLNVKLGPRHKSQKGRAGCLA